MPPRRSGSSGPSASFPRARCVSPLALLLASRFLLSLSCRKSSFFFFFFCCAGKHAHVPGNVFGFFQNQEAGCVICSFVCPPPSLFPPPLSLLLSAAPPPSLFSCYPCYLPCHPPLPSSFLPRRLRSLTFFSTLSLLNFSHTRPPLQLRFSKHQRRPRYCMAGAARKIVVVVSCPAR